ncbi:ArsR/SmtB family transcription factor [Paraclostridium bifermentans]|uniref:ArsR/SmtB family transcription factor n=1 Tax=Paraclostridium bifermentans TaxID=1490 RepID=UPI0018AC3ACC|nr:metalloregulator ArsR/SmtB family transcription factor [Paraclostridium bifermentans]UOW66523.1 metalloregulator ArsR/SmtB family transcription factor [Paraclostridium bifermentans]
MSYEEIFKALADKKRLEILRTLNKKGSTCVCKLVDEFDLSQSKLSYHLKLLLDNNLIVKISQGKWNYYDINKETLKSVLNENIIEEILK